MGFLSDFDLTLAHWKAKVRLDYPVAWKFEVEIEGISDKGFATCTGLNKILFTETLVECNTPEPTFLPIVRTINPIVLTKAVSFNSQMEQWYQQIESYQRGAASPKRNVIVRQLYNIPAVVPYLGGKAIELKSWHINNCAILELKYPDFDASKGDQISIQTVTLKSTDVVETADYGALGSLMAMMQQFAV